MKLVSAPGRRKDSPRRSGGSLPLVIILSAAVILLLAVILVLVLRPADVTEPLPSEMPTEEIIEAEPTPSPSTHIEFAGIQIPIVSDVPVNDYGVENFALREDGAVEYTAGWAVQGIDISAFQEDVDWEAVAESGIEFVILRVAYRGYGTGRLLLDELFYEHVEGALAAGLDIGVYVFSQAINVKEAEQEAEFVLNAIEGYPIKYPVVFDWERVLEEDSRTRNLGTQAMSACARAFCRRIEEAGYTPTVYINMSEGYLGFDLTVITEYDIWLAEYDDHPDFYYDFTLWQYTCEGYVPGIEGYVDRNLCFKDFGIG